LAHVVKGWTAKRKSALFMESLQDKTTVAEASRSYDLSHPRSRDGSVMPAGAWRMHWGEPARCPAGIREAAARPAVRWNVSSNLLSSKAQEKIPSAGLPERLPAILSLSYDYLFFYK